MREALWHLRAKLTCDHEVDFGVVPESEIDRLIPRRKDHSFGSLRCPHGRRRIVFTQSSTTVSNQESSQP